MEFSVGFLFCLWMINYNLSVRQCVGVGVLDDPLLVYLFIWFGLSGVRVSGGHLCEAEAPTEPAGETASPYEMC